MASPSSSASKVKAQDIFGNIPTQDSRQGGYQAFEDEVEVDYNN